MKTGGKCLWKDMELGRLDDGGCTWKSENEESGGAEEVGGRMRRQRTA